MRIIEQGDVILIKKEGAAKGEKLSHNVVQEGEHTGHAHRITSGNATIFNDNGALSIRVLGGGATITHEEHLPVEIEEGEYEVRIVRQKDPFTKLVSKVVD
jgi:hypothetical protein